jgi:glycosyltransferase involved in cell wall biosynthesis
LRILQVIEFFTPSTGGSTQIAYHLSFLLNQLGHQVTVCTSNYGKDQTQFRCENIKVERFTALPTRWRFYITPGLIPWTRKHLREFNIIHLHNVRTFQNLIIANQARKRGIPYVLSAHGSLPHVGNYYLAKSVVDNIFADRLIKGAQRLIAVSDMEARQYQNAGIEREKISLIHNGLDLEEFAILPARGLFRLKYSISDQTKIILFLGRLHKIKGIDQIITAFNTLNNHLKKFILVIAGPDDGVLSNLQRMTAQFGIGGQVIFTGPLYRQEKLSAYVDADVLVSPGIYEIFGLVSFEAIMCGTPVIVSDNSGLGQLIKEAGAGYTISPGNIKALAAALKNIVDYPEEARQKVEAGQRYIRENLDWNKITSKLIDLYQECIQ